MKKNISNFLHIISLTTLFILYSSNSFSNSVLKEELKVKEPSYFYLDNLFEGKAVKDKDRFYFKAGKANGKWITFYKNGNLKSIIDWKNGKLDGKYIIYLENGNKVSETFYTEGKENGIYLAFHPNGQIRIIGQYSMSKPIGVWKFYDKFGKLIGKNNLK